MSEADLYALAWFGVAALWVFVLTWIAAEAGFDPARLPVVGPVLERTWNAILTAARRILGMKH